MAGERRRFLGELAAWHVATVVRHLPLTGTALDPQTINPYRRVATAAATELDRWHKRRMFRALVNAHRRKKKE